MEKEIKFNDYILGLLYGDGSFTIKEGRDFFQFSSVHKELADRIANALDDNNIHYAHYRRSFERGHENENYEILEIIEIYDKRLMEHLENSGFKSEQVSDRIRLTGDFLRGYLETKGTLFQSNSRGNVFWRISLSGNEDEMLYIKSFFNDKGLKTNEVAQRKEREAIGIVSGSYRLSVQNRQGLAFFINHIDGEEVTSYLKERIEGFKHFDRVTPYNMKRKIFKHFKFAVGFMARELDIEIKGVRGISIKDRQKPVFLFEEDDVKLCYRNWEHAYNWICKEFQEETGMIPPKVEIIQ